MKNDSFLAFMNHENLLNIIAVGWSFLVLSEYITFVLGALTGVTLIWMNVERALKARKERRNNDQED